MDARLATAHSLTGDGYDWKRPAYIYVYSMPLRLFEKILEVREL